MTTEDWRQDELYELCAAVCDNAADAETYARLREILKQSSQARRFYIRYLNTHAHLSGMAANRVLSGDASTTPPGGPVASPNGPVASSSQAAGTSASAALPAPPPPPIAAPTSDGDRPIDSPKTTLFSYFPTTERWLDAMPVAMFAVLMLSIGLLVGWRVGTRQIAERAETATQVKESDRLPPQDPAADRTLAPAAPMVARVSHAATLVDARDCQWIEATAEFHPGATIEQGSSLRLAAGVAEIMFRSGVRLTLEGPAVLSEISAGGGVLESGSLAADVPPDAIGFAVKTPAATVIDLSTSFGVTVDQARVTEVHVIEGRVAIESHASARRQVLAAPLARRLPSKDPSTWVEIEAAPERFYRTATARFSPAAEVQTAVSGPNAPAPDPSVSSLPPIDGVERWTVLSHEPFDGLAVNNDRWEVHDGHPIDRQPGISVKGGALELLNCAVLMSRAGFATTADKPLRVTARWEAQGALDKPTIGIVGNFPAQKAPGGWMPYSIVCTFGAINPQTREPSLSVVYGYLERQETDARYVPCPAPEAGGVYRLDVVRYPRRLVFEVVRLDGEGWTHRVTPNISTDFAPGVQRRVALVNMDLESTADVVSRVDEITVSTWDASGGP